MVRCLAVAAAFVLVCAWPAPKETVASPAYRAYAIKLVTNLPAGARIRPDLEAELDAMASAARRKAGKSAVRSSDLLRQAARAQAVEMLKGNFVGHRSASGFRFRQRFEAFGGDERGDFAEIAARDRQSGAVDKAKARRLFGQWLKSAGHKRQLMNRWYKYVSTGAIQRGHHLYAVQIFWEK